MAKPKIPWWAWVIGKYESCCKEERDCDNEFHCQYEWSRRHGWNVVHEPLVDCMR